jgi:hypothetical protein
MITIVLPISRPDYLNKVITRIELLDYPPEEINFLAIVDGDDALYIKARNMVSSTKYPNRLCVKSTNPGKPARYDVYARRRRIAAIHNQAKELIAHDTGYVFLVEDDTMFNGNALKKLMDVAINNRAFAFAEGVELGRWGVPYVGAWLADDIYEPTELKSVENLNPVPVDQPAMKIDAGGLYCALVRADLYKQHTFTSDNGLGPDINFGLENRQLGFENFLVWTVPCTHIFEKNRVEKQLTPTDESRVVTLAKISSTKWEVRY